MLNNINWATPEIFLSIVAVSLLWYGVIACKFGGKVGQTLKINNLSILALFITGLLLIGELSALVSSGVSSVSISLDLLSCTEYILLIKIVLVFSSALIILLGNESTYKDKMYDFEYSQLILLSTLGMMFVIGSSDLLMLYLGIELLSLSLYVLAAIKRNREHSTEAGLKYFLLGALSSGLLLFGMALIYAFTGETGFVGLSNYIWFADNEPELVMGAIFIVISLIFKLGGVPFHMWVPDVYEGAPNIVTAYFAIVPKIATLGILIILLNGPFLGIFIDIQPIILFCGILSIIVGGIGALNQGKLKRLLAYSAISHVGFLSIGVGTNTLLSLHATLIYILLYIVMSFGTFAFVLNVFKHGNFITQLSGLSRSNPILALTFAFILLSIAGVPPLAGFYSKYLILLSALDNGLFLISFFAVMGSAVSAFYYLRIIKWMFFKDSSYYHYKDLGDVLYPVQNNLHVNFIGSIIMGGSLFIILTFLFYPTPLLNLSMTALSSSLI